MFVYVQMLLVENERLRFEVKRLKFDNSQLVKKTRDAEAEKNKVLVLRTQHAPVLCLVTSRCVVFAAHDRHERVREG